MEFDLNQQRMQCELTSDLLYALGIDIDPRTNCLIYQETKQNILFQGKNVKATRDINRPVYITESDIKLEPADPRCNKLVDRLFGKYLDQLHEENEIPQVVTYTFETDKDTHKSRLAVKFADGTYQYSNWYNNRILGYADMILFDDITMEKKYQNLFSILDVSPEDES